MCITHIQNQGISWEHWCLSGNLFNRTAGALIQVTRYLKVQGKP